MRQLASLLFVWSLRCCFQENMVESFKCGSGQMTVQWPNGTFKQCLHCEECHPGRGLYPHKCGDTVTFPVIIHCKKCDSGKTFSDTYDTSSCKLCHSCAEHEVVTKKCTLSSDTKCNKTCNSGYFFSKPQQICQTCSHCCLDGKDEEQLQCIYQGLKEFNRYCSPRPDRTCNPSTPTGLVVSTVSTVSLSSSSKHLNEPTSQQQNGKIALILSSVGLGLLFVFVTLGVIYCQRKRIWRRWKRNNCNLRDVGDESVYSDTKGHMSAEGLQQKQNKGFVPTPQGSHTVTPSQTDDELDDLPDVESINPKRPRRRPSRTEEIKVVSVRENLLDDKEFNNAETSRAIDGKGAEGGHERKRSITGPILRRLSSISNDYEPLPVEDPDQSAEGVPQRKCSRSNSLLNALRKSSIHAVKEENSNQPLGQSWPPEEVTIKLFPNSPEIPQAGSRVKFQCTVRGCQQDLMFYWWFKDEQELQGEANSTLILDPLKVQDFGSYRCEVSRSNKRDDSSCVESDVVELDVTPAEGKSYRKLAEVFENDLILKETVANLLQKETNVCRKAYKRVAFYYKMTDIADQLERCKNPGEDVLDSLKSTQPDLTVHHFCMVLKGENIRRLDIVNKLIDYLV
ncbi:uncharacterized protein LOC141879336 isoform X2 [Acropora palmata]|uniref:uncharacterized protein LOC141879336 isoform X2 n=1 Tax=Acropora palmata TaxID=6131 RepID=UPI003DA0FB09